MPKSGMMKIDIRIPDWCIAEAEKSGGDPWEILIEALDPRYAKNEPDRRLREHLRDAIIAALEKEGWE